HRSIEAISRSDSLHGSAANVERTCCSDSAETACTVRTSSSSGPPSRRKPRSTRSSMNRACSSQPRCSRMSTPRSHSGPVRVRTTRYSTAPTITFAAMEALRLRVDELVLRPPCEADVRALVAACQDPEIVRFTRVPSPYTEEHARQYLDG